MTNLKEYLLCNPYHGRGIIIGQNGSNAVVAYFIMGRSANSRNRVFREEGCDVVIYPFDASKVSDPSLIIYSPIKCVGDTVIVTNGDQTETICGRLGSEFAFEIALNTRTFEPDPPCFTPRISGLLNLDENNYKLSILKSEGKGKTCRRFTFAYEPIDGVAHFIHTYNNGKAEESFQGEPVEVAVGGSIDELTAEIWSCLNADNKISLAVKYFDTETKKTQTRIINKNV